MDVEFERRKIVVDALKESCNIHQLVILDPVKPEATQHVDMFATFLAADQVLVAQVDPRQDPVNAQILDNNARKLAKIKVDGKPLRVERIPVPKRDGKYWSPYTNIILSNKTILMPVYKSDPPSIVKNAVNVYKRLMPGFKVDTVDMTTMRKLEGALHCMSVNIPKFAELPDGVMTFKQARKVAGNPGQLARQKPKRAPREKSVLKNDFVATTPNLSLIHI